LQIFEYLRRNLNLIPVRPRTGRLVDIVYGLDADLLLQALVLWLLAIN
jgi:hypothetical protein